MDRTTRQKINKETEGLNNTVRPIRLNRHIQNTPPQTAEYVLKCIWNILHDRPHVNPQNKSKQI